MPEDLFSGINDINKTKSKAIWEELQKNGFIDINKKITSSFLPNEKDFTLNLGDDYTDSEQAIIERL